MSQALAFVDLETTGANPLLDRITEIGIVSVTPDGQVSEWSTLVNPGCPISPFIEQLTGISDAMVAGAPRFSELAEELKQRLAGHLFIAHNARFDYGFIKQELKRAGHGFRAPVLCTVKLSRKLFPEHAKHNLDALMARHGLKAESRHRALSDARLIHQFWQVLQSSPGSAAVEAAMAVQLVSSRLPPHLEAQLDEDPPDGPGIYFLHGDEDKLLYLGRAKDIGKKLASHFASAQGSSRDIQLAAQVRRVAWRETASETGAQLLEAVLNSQLAPPFNRQHRQGGEPCTWTLETMPEGWPRPRLTPVDSVDFSIQTPCYGLFKNPKEAHAALEALASEFRLCDRLLGLDDGEPGQPCLGRMGKRCKGACIGHENPAQHAIRLLSGLTRLKLPAWPFRGAALFRDGQEIHLVNAWRYLGCARSEDEIGALLTQPLPPFDREIHKVLTKAAGQLRACT